MTGQNDALLAVAAGFVLATLAQLPSIVDAHQQKAARDAAYAEEYQP